MVTFAGDLYLKVTLVEECWLTRVTTVVGYAHGMGIEWTCGIETRIFAALLSVWAETLGTLSKGYRVL